MKTGLAKSPEVLAKEKKIKDLKANLKKSRSTLKSLKTRLKNMQEEVTEKQNQMFTKGILKMEDAEKLRLEVIAWGKKFLKIKGIGKEEKMGMKMLLEQFSDEDFFGPDFAEYKKTKQEVESGDFNYSEQNKSRMEAMFLEFQVKPEEKEQRDIRKVFLKLSKLFHPDKAKTEKEAGDFHEIMQQLNHAYQNNDIQAIFDIERKYVGVEEGFEVTIVTLDGLQAVIDSLSKELGFIKNQITRTKKEVSGLRKSDLGQMLTEMNRAEKAGVGLSFMAQQTDELIAHLTRLRDALQDSVKLNKFSPLLEEILDESMDEMDDDFFFDDGPGSVLDALIGSLIEDPKEVEAFRKSLKFPIGSYVRIKKTLKAPGMEKGNLKGWQGRVTDAHSEFDKIYYEIEFDKATIEQMSPSYIRNRIIYNYPFESLEITEQYLEVCEARGNAEADKLIQRKVFHQYKWEYLGKDMAALMIKIMSRLAKGDDLTNWKTYLTENLRFPFEAKISKNSSARRRKRSSVCTVIGFDKPDDSLGIMMRAKVGETMVVLPLFELEGLKSSKYGDLLFLYQAWWAVDSFVENDEFPF